MTLDLVILGAALFFAIWGFFSGAAKQIATLLAGLIAWFAAGPAGQFFGPVVAKKLATSQLVGTVLAALASFAVLLLFVQIVGTMLIRRALAGRDPTNRTLDRLLGFLIGGGKVLAVMYVALCAMSFLEKNVSVMGQQLAFSPRDSELMKLVRRYNLLEQQQFAGARELLRVAKLAKDPRRTQQLKENADFVALAKDPRFTRLLRTPAAQKAVDGDDLRALLGTNEAIDLIHDGEMVRRLERVSALGGE